MSYYRLYLETNPSLVVTLFSIPELSCKLWFIGGVQTEEMRRSIYMQHETQGEGEYM
jgi:hypothetical protein